MKTSKAVRLALQEQKRSGPPLKHNSGGYSTLAKLLSDHGHPCTRQNVHQWGDDLPEVRVYQLREIRPQWFTTTKPRHS